MIKLLKNFLSFNKTPKAPPYLIHFVEQRCNAVCPHCFVYSDEYEEINSGEVLSINEIRKVCSTLKGHLYSVILTGGEPFLRNDFEDICHAYLDEADVNILIICTNGWFTDKTLNLIEKLSTLYPNKSFDVSISLDELENKHDEYRGTKGGFQRALKTYMGLMALKKKNVSVHINLTSNQKNNDNLSNIYHSLKYDYAIESVSVSPAAGFAKDKKSLEIDRSKYMNFMNSIKWNTLKENKRHFAGDILSAKDRYLKYTLTPKIWSKGYQTPCYAGRLAGVIHADGNVYPCERLMAPIGNLKDFDLSFLNLWKSLSAKKTRNWIWKNKCSCDHECFMGINILFNPVQLTKSFKEYFIIKIQRIKRIL